MSWVSSSCLLQVNNLYSQSYCIYCFLAIAMVAWRVEVRWFAIGFSEHVHISTPPTRCITARLHYRLISPGSLCFDPDRSQRCVYMVYCLVHWACGSTLYVRMDQKQNGHPMHTIKIIIPECEQACINVQEPV